MKNYKFLIAFFILISFAGYSQAGKITGKAEQVKSLKVAYITNQLALTPAEAEKFWPLYNGYEEKQRELRKQKMGSYLARMDNAAIDKISEKEASIALAQMENTEDELYQLRKRFISNLKNVLPAVKIIKLQKAEEQFNRKLLKQYREKARRR